MLLPGQRQFSGGEGADLFVYRSHFGRSASFSTGRLIVWDVVFRIFALGTNITISL